MPEIHNRGQGNTSPTFVGMPDAPGSYEGAAALNPRVTTDETGMEFAVGGGGAGDVVGPASSTDNALARFNGTTGKVIQQSVVIVSDAGDVSGIDDQDMTGHLTMERISTPSAPAVNHGRLFTRLNGGNICLIFQSATGAELDIGCILNVADTQTLPKDKVQ